MGLRSNLGWSLLANALSGIVSFVGMIWFARHLGKAIIGDYAAITAVMHLVSGFFSFGFDQAVIKYRNTQEVRAAAASGVAVQAVLLLVAYGALGLANPGGDVGLHLRQGTMIYGATVLSYFAYLAAAPAAACQDFRFLGLVRVASVFLGFFAAGLAVVLGVGEYALATRDLVMFLSMLVLVCGIRREWFTFKATTGGVLKVLRFSAKTWLLNVCERISYRVDYLLVGALFGVEPLGGYFVMRSLIDGSLSLLVQPIQTVLFSHYCNDGAERGGVASVLASTRVPVLVIVGLLLLMPAFLFAEPLILWLLGEEYRSIIGIAPWLVLNGCALVCFEQSKIRRMAQERHGSLVVPRLVQMAASSLLMVPLTRAFGMTGAGMAAAAGGVCLAMLAWPRRLPVAELPDRESRVEPDAAHGS